MAQERSIFRGVSIDAIELPPCHEYRLDMTGARYGDCVCGRPRAAHFGNDAAVDGLADAVASAPPPTPTSLPTSPALRSAVPRCPYLLISAHLSSSLPQLPLSHHISQHLPISQPRQQEHAHAHAKLACGLPQVP